MKRENFYILLELPFNPPVNDEAQIKAAIHAKQQEWSRLYLKEDRQSEALKYMEQIPLIEEVMLDVSKREDEAVHAGEIYNSMRSSFEAELRVLEGKGYILPKDIRQLHNKYRSFGFTIDFINSLIRVPITETAPKLKQQSVTIKALHRDKVNLISNHLSVLGQKDLYSFLGRSQGSSPQDLTYVAKAMYHNAFHSGERSGENTATQMLSEISVEIFASDATKASYDLFLSINTYPKLNGLIEEENQRSGFISPEILMRLVNFGVTTYGTSVLELEEYIRRYCEAYDIKINITSPEIICPNCRAHSPRGSVYCETCGAPLEGHCPKCNTFFSDGAVVCASCSFPIGEMGKALTFMEQTKTALIENNWGAAKHYIAYAEKYWPTNPELDGLKAKTGSIETHYQDTMNEIENTIGKNCYYTARQLIRKAQGENISIPSEIVESTDNIINDFEKQLKVLKTRGSISYDNLNLLASHVADSLELGRMLSQYPPEQPFRFTARASDSSVHLSWDKSPSTGVIVHVVVRKDGSVPLTAFDGEIVYEGEGNSFIDENVPPLRSFYYSVFARRGNSYSEIGTVSTTPVTIVPDLKNLIISPANNAAQLSWDPPLGLLGVKIWRKQGGDMPTAPGEGEFIETRRLDGYADVNISNGNMYWYYVVAVYRTPDGKHVESNGVCDNVTPHTFLSPVDNFTITPAAQDHYYFINWEGAHNEEVVFFSARSKPSFPAGKMIPIDTLLENYNRLTLENSHDNSAKFGLKITGGIYVFSVIVSGRFGAVGRIEYVTNVPDVDSVTYDIIDNDLFINFKWPSGQLINVVAVWRQDDFPKSLSQKGSHLVDYSREEYDFEAGIKVPDLVTGRYYIKLYSSFMSQEGKKVYSDGVELLVDNTPAKEIFYDIRYRRPLFHSNRKLTVTVYSNHVFNLPRALIVGKVGSVPISIADGEALFEIKKVREIAGSVSYEYRTGQLPKNMYIRMFFYDDTVYHKLRPIPGRLRIT